MLDTRDVARKSEEARREARRAARVLEQIIEYLDLYGPESTQKEEPMSNTADNDFTIDPKPVRK